MLRAQARNIRLGLMSADFGLAALLFVLFGLAELQKSGEPIALSWVASLSGPALTAGLLWLLLLSRSGVYASQRRDPTMDVLGRLLMANGFGALVLSAVALALEIPVAPLAPLFFAGVLFGFQGVIRLTAYAVLRALRRTGRNYRNVLIIGSGNRALEVEGSICRHPEWGLRMVGFVDEVGNGHVPLVAPERLHKLIDLPALLRDENIDETLVAVPRSMLGQITPVVRECALLGVPVTLLTDLYGDDLPRPRVGSLESRSTLTFAPVHHSEVELMVKRGIDIVGALAGLAVSAPILLVSALAIKLTSKGPVLFRQTRCGLHGHRFEMLKLRTMTADAEQRKAELLELNEMDGPVFKIRADPRITSVGHILRRFSIDELPQFWNVLRGNMSLVGPRPPTPDEVIQYRGEVRRRLSMRPGLTCLWQVSGRNEVSFEEWMALDLEYIDTWSLENDLRILLRTVPTVVLARGAS
jgi:exopolysaccharide biosynthesis polyprenyl glycosylphosphotransferase